MTADWHHSTDWRTQYAATEDPRVILVIQTDTEPSAPYGDALAPAFWAEYRDGYRVDPAGDVFHDDDSEQIARRYADALERFAYRITHTVSPRGYVTPTHVYDPRGARRDAVVARWLRVFHGTTMTEVRSQDSVVWIFNTPTYREHVGTPDSYDAATYLDGDRAEWRAYLDGDVYGIGYAVDAARVLPDDDTAPGGPSFDPDDWGVQIEAWGFYGESYAKESAEAFEAGEPSLPPMLALVPAC